jgi:hypothetical protein
MGCGLEKGPEKNECRRQQAEDGEEKMNIGSADFFNVTDR